MTYREASNKAAVLLGLPEPTCVGMNKLLDKHKPGFLDKQVPEQMREQAINCFVWTTKELQRMQPQ